MQDLKYRKYAISISQVCHFYFASMSLIIRKYATPISQVCHSYFASMPLHFASMIFLFRKYVTSISQVWYSYFASMSLLFRKYDIRVFHKYFASILFVFHKYVLLLTFRKYITIHREHSLYLFFNDNNFNKLTTYWIHPVVNLLKLLSLKNKYSKFHIILVELVLGSSGARGWDCRLQWKGLIKVNFFLWQHLFITLLETIAKRRQNCRPNTRTNHSKQICRQITRTNCQKMIAQLRKQIKSVAQLRRQTTAKLSPNREDQPQQNCRRTARTNRSKIVAKPRRQTVAKLPSNYYMRVSGREAERHRRCDREREDAVTR